MARSIQGSPFVRKVVLPESSQKESDVSNELGTSSPMGVTSEISGMGEFTSPRTVRAEDASSLGDTPALRKSSRVRKSTLLATFATAAATELTANELKATELTTELKANELAPSSEMNERVSELTIKEATEKRKNNVKQVQREQRVQGEEEEKNELLDWCLGEEQAVQLSVKKKVEQVVTELEGKPEETLLQILNCVLLISGVQAHIDPEDLNVEDPAQVILRFLNNDKLLHPPLATLLGKRVSKAVFKKYFELFKSIGTAGMGIDAVVAVVASDLIPWLTTLSSVSLRSLRISATVAALGLLSGSCECARGLQRSAESTKRVAKRVTEVSAKLAATEQVMQALFDSVFVQRYRDVCEDVRMFCVEQLVCWMESYASVFVENSYLRYLGWSLSDASAKVRQEAIQGLVKVYSAEGGASLVSFSERFQDRIVQVIERDGQNRARALGLLDLAFSKGLISLDLTSLLLQAITSPSEFAGFEWKRCKNIIEGTFGDSAQLLSSLTKQLRLEEWREWEESLVQFAAATEIMDPLTNLHSSPLAVFWIPSSKVQADLLLELMQLDIPHEVYYARVASLLSSQSPEMVDPDALARFVQKAALVSEEAVRRLIPAIQQYKLAASLMNLLASAPKSCWRGILALCTVCEPPVIPLSVRDALGEDWVALAQIEYRRILWLLKRNPDSLDARHSVEDLYRAVDIRTHFEEEDVSEAFLKVILGIWVDLLLLGKKKLEPSPLAVTDADIDFCVKKAALCKSLQAPVGLAIAKLLLAGLITPQVALRDLCALPTNSEFEEHGELVSLAVEHCLSLGSQSLSSKFNLVRGILQMRPNLAKPLLLGLKDALKRQADDNALDLFLEALSKSAQPEVWSLVGSLLLKDLPEAKAKAIDLRPFTAAQRKKRLQNDLADGESASSLPPSSLPSSESSMIEEESKENILPSTIESPMKKPRTRRGLQQKQKKAAPKNKPQEEDSEETMIIRL